MQDIKFIRENPALIKRDMEKRFMNPDLVNELLKKDEDYRKKLYKVEQLKHKRNLVTDEIRKLKKEGKSIKEKLIEAKKIPEEIKNLDDKVCILKEDLDNLLMKMPQIMSKGVPKGEKEDKNKLIKKVGRPKKFKFDVKSHVELLEKMNLVDFESSAKIAGNGFYYMFGDLALLNRALINYSIDFMSHKGFTYLETPLMVKTDVLEGVCSHEEIEHMAYKVEKEDLYLIATSEHPIIGMFKDKVIDEKKLPIKLFCFSPCFRREVGSHGIDEKGLFRTHQFNKVEMIVLCKEKDADKHYKEMMKLSKEIYKNLDIPIRLMNWCSGELGVLRRKAVEFESWSPRKKEYSEIGSLSDTGTSQSRRLNIRATNGKDKYFVNTLNNTVIATSRALVALVENHQTKDEGINIPKALMPYMNGKRVIKRG